MIGSMENVIYSKRVPRIINVSDHGQETGRN